MKLLDFCNEYILGTAVPVGLVIVGLFFCRSIEMLSVFSSASAVAGRDDTSKKGRHLAVARPVYGIGGRSGGG